MKEYIKKLTAGRNLTIEEAQKAMDLVLDGGATPAQISAFLVALRMKGETIDEITGCALTMKEKAFHITPKASNYIDCVGTGGDGVNTFNISTTAAFVIAAAGVPVAKHGNRAISSRSGSVDVLEKLGINVMTSPEQTQRCVDEAGIGFMFARIFHSHMKTVTQVRGELGIRTIFNILGPLSNPSGAECQVIGLFDKELTNPFANAMLKMGVKRGLVMHGIDDGVDEFSISGETKVSEIKDGKVVDYIYTPEQAGLSRAAMTEIIGGAAEENAEITRRILSGEAGAKRDIVVLNAGAAIYAAGKAESIAEGARIAEKAIDSGAAMAKLNEIISFTAQF